MPVVIRSTDLWTEPDMGSVIHGFCFLDEFGDEPGGAGRAVGLDVAVADGLSGGHLGGDDPITVGIPGPHYYPLAPSAPRPAAATHRSCAAPGAPRSWIRPGRAEPPLRLPGTAGPPARPPPAE